jgi:formylglycine-generating enzyme required for sulfatase activity
MNVIRLVWLFCIVPALCFAQNDGIAAMVLVEGGAFQMGIGYGGEEDEKPVHRVTLRSFYLGVYEVTQKEWIAIMGTNPSTFKGDALPVETVSWYEAVEFCNILSRKEGYTPAYRGSGASIICDFNADGYRLPTEAEWEYAAKGGAGADDPPFEYAGGNDVDAVGWHDGNSGGTPQPVGTRLPNSLGLYDMSGNVWEWCWDRYGPYSGASQTDPQGPAGPASPQALQAEALRTDRGGSWNHGAQFLRSANRDAYIPSYRYWLLGFRLCRSSL